VPTAYQSSRYIYSKSPTAVPTCSPTLSELSVWTNRLQETLGEVSVNDTSSVAHRATYYELDVVSGSPYRRFGSCAAWLALLSAELTPAKYSYNAQSLKISAQVDGTPADHSASFAPFAAQCSDPSAVTAILTALLGGPKFAAGAVTSRGFSCSGMTWVVKHCPVGASSTSAVTYAPALCANCDDPCLATNHCNADHTPSPPGALVVAPCVAQSCTGSSPTGGVYSSPTALRVISVAYSELQAPPSLLSVTATSTKRTIRVTAALSASGIVYAAVYPVGAAVAAPASLAAVEMQNIVAVANMANVSTLVVASLDPLTSYKVYLMTASSVGVRSTLAQVLTSGIAVNTTCCKTITATLAATTAVELQRMPSILTVSLEARPRTTLNMQLQLYTVGEDESRTLYTANTLFPATTAVTSQSTSTVFTAALPALPVGNYEYRLSYSGPSAAEFDLTYSNGQVINVLSASAQPPPPALTRAQFAADGSYLTIALSAATNKAGLSTTFTCSALFDFVCASTSKCQWIDASTVRAYVAGTTCTRPGAVLKLKQDNALQAKCLATGDDGSGRACTGYDTWLTAPVGSGMQIYAPANAVAPAVSISAPAVLGGCDDLRLDISSSTGSGGRAWANVTAAVSALSGVDSTAVSSALAAIRVWTPPPVLPSRLFQRGVTYNFAVTLCNFLGQCNTGSKKVLTLNETVPSLSLPGPALRSITTREQLNLASSAFVSTCDGKRSSTGLTYQWALSLGNVAVLGLTSTAKDSSRYILPAYSLVPGSLYQITLTVNLAGSTQSSAVSTQIFVQPGKVMASIRGGNTRVMRVDGTPAVLDASASYDEDINGPAAGLTFTWSCLQTAPVYDDTCTGIFSNIQPQTNLPSFTVVPKAESVGAAGQFTVTVADASRQRRASTTVSVTVLPSLAPVVTISAPTVPSSLVMNAGQILQLVGTLSVPASLGGGANWTVDDSSIDLASIGLFPTYSHIAPVGEALSGTVISKTIYMAIPGNSLPPGATLTFSLVGSSATRQAVGSITIAINAPPIPGTFAVDPSDGVELQQSFQYLAAQWVDSDLPLTYLFGYVAVDGSSVTLRSRVEVSFATSLLTAGDVETGHQVTCFAQIFDSLSANSSATYGVTVRPNAGFNSSQVEAFIQASLASAQSDVDSIKQAAVQSSYLLNAVNCTLPAGVNCTALSRQRCFNTPHTCGACVSVEYIGEEGDSNEACLSIYAPEARTALRRSTALFRLSTGVSPQDMTGAVPNDMLKPCAANCSGHGTCAHVMRDSGDVITADISLCVKGALDCLAVCLCDADYYGSDTCDVTTEEFITRQASRADVITGVRKLVSLENADEQVVTSWVGALSMASQRSAELTEDSAGTLIQLVDTVTLSAQTVASSGGLSSDALKGLLRTIDAVAENAVKAQVRRRLLLHARRLSTTEMRREVSSTAFATQALVQNVGAVVAQSMLPGQGAIEFTQGQFNLGVHVLDYDGSNAEVSATLSVPQSAAERFLGVPATTVSLPASSAAADKTSVVVASLRSQQYAGAVNGDLQSNTLSLLTSAPLCETAPCYVDIVLQNSESVDYASLNAHDSHNVSVECKAGDSNAHEATCPDGTVVPLQCPGYAATVSQRCPVTAYAGTCNTLSGGDATCTVLSYTETTTTCRCDTSSASAAVTSRRALSQLPSHLNPGYNVTQPDGYSVSYVAMLQSTTNTFVSTIQTADDLNASTVTKGWRALATLGTLAAAILTALYWSNRADHHAKKVQATPEEQAVHNAQDAERKKSAKKKADGSSGRDKKIRFNTRAKKALVNAELAIVEESLPKVLSSRTFTDSFLEEVKQHHRWFGIVFYYSDAFPRVLRVISLATNAIVMLFIQSITYNLTNPDDGTCELLHTETACLQPRSPFATGESKCAWVPTDSAVGSGDGYTCIFLEPDKSIRIILFVAIFCAVVTTPIALAADWLVGNVLAAPTETPTSVEVDNTALDLLIRTAPGANEPTGLAPMLYPSVATTSDAELVKPSEMKRKASLGALAGFLNVFNTEMKLKEDKAILTASRAELMMLSVKLKRYRESLRADELEEFDCKCRAADVVERFCPTLGLPFVLTVES
jgi:hypothetical protein